MSAIMARFSCSVVRRISATCSRQLLPKMVHTGVAASMRALQPGSSAGRVFARRVLPKAATRACFIGCFRISWKKAMSLGFEAANPPSM